jgi:fermentation-respiration switch protein FrsA (DUF1100 family)
MRTGPSPRVGTHPGRRPRSRLLFRLLSLGVGVVLAIGITGVATAGTDDIPGDQPLPGYTINNPPLAPIVVNGAPTTVRQGVHEHAAYIIETPAAWNGDLVMWTHGYRGQGFVLFPETPAFGLRQRLLGQGYAWAASSYYDNGFDIRAGVLSTKDLALLFRDLVDRPHRTLIAGVSMGGYIIGRSLEQYPHFYDGALPMCGVMGDQTLLDFFLDYNVVAQALAGITAYPIPADYLTNAVPRIQVTLGLVGLTPTGPDTTNDLGKQLRAITINRSGGPRPGANAAFASWKDFLFGIAAGATGETPAQNPAQLSTNIFTRYEPNSPVDVNATVTRVLPQLLRERLSPTLTQVPRIEGRPGVPVLSLHGLGDLFVPFSMEQRYFADVQRHHQGRFLVQRAIRAVQHCEFTPTEVGTAWDQLVSWVHGGAKPAGDTVSDPDVVADPNYGCQFSDAAAYAAGVGTRRLFAACP